MNHTFVEDMEVSPSLDEEECYENNCGVKILPPARLMSGGIRESEEQRSKHTRHDRCSCEINDVSILLMNAGVHPSDEGNDHHWDSCDSKYEY